MTADAARRRLQERDLLDLAKRVAAAYHEPLDAVLGKLRFPTMVRARDALCWALDAHPERLYTGSEIARLMGRDHATIRAAIRRHQARIEDGSGVAINSEFFGSNSSVPSCNDAEAKEAGDG